MEEITAEQIDQIKKIRLELLEQINYFKVGRNLLNEGVQMYNKVAKKAGLEELDGV
jgi:hypothetical protein